MTCKEENAVPIVDELCVCDIGFYDTNPLFDILRCEPCPVNCGKCSDDFTCDECIDENAELVNG